MKKIQFYLLFILLNVITTQAVSAQNGKFDVKIETDYSDLDNRKLGLEISIRADNANTTFHAADFNFVISHDGDGILKKSENGYLPTIDATNGISGPYYYGSEFTFYGSPSAGGSVGAITKYTLPFVSGDGAFIDENYLYIGKIIFDFEESPTGDPREVNFILHDETMAPAPVSSVEEMIGGGATADAELDESPFVDDVYDSATQGKFRLGIYDTKVVTDCSMVANDDVLALEIYMKAHVDDTYFFASDLNFRLTHDGVGTLKTAVPNGYLPTADNGPTTNHPNGGLNDDYWNETNHNPFPAERSGYGDPTTTGSTHNITSYNQEMESGIGTFLTDENWVYVGRILYELEETRDAGAPNIEDIIFELHDHSPEMFPPTFIGEKHSNTLYEAAEGSYDEIAGANCTGVLRMATTSFEKGSTTDIKVFPNPSTNSIELELEDYTGLKSLEIYNILGERIMMIDADQERQTIDISKLAPSTYVVKATFDNGKSNSTKFTKM